MNESKYPQFQPDIKLSESAYDASDFVGIFFWTIIRSNPNYWNHMISSAWKTTAELNIPEGSNLLKTTIGNSYKYNTYFYKGVLVQTAYTNSVKTISVQIVANKAQLSQEVMSELKALYPIDDYADEEEETIDLKFWYNSTNGPTNISRTIDIPSWESIQANYSPVIHTEMIRLIALDGEVDGKLILWHGLPGTGKTFAIRALAWEWRKWASFEYITDPDQFLNDPNYMVKVGLQADNTGIPLPYYENYDGEADDREEEIVDKWKVLILEDSGELIAYDAKERTGQALSRLLNMMDGLIGQGLKLMILITTNEKIEHLHTAASRAGRSLSVVEFPALNKDQANEWLRSQGSEFEATGSIQLADLYAIKRNPEHKFKYADTRTGFRT